MNEPTGYPGAPPAWYPDPAGGPGQRWWDGYNWTDATVLPAQPPPPPWATAPPPPPAAAQAVQVAPWAVASQRLTAFTSGATVDAELRMARIGRVAVAVPAACAIVNLVITRLNEDRLLAYGNYFRLVWHDTQNQITPPRYTGPSPSTPLSLVVSLLFVAAAIVALVWQHRAASAGRALGIRSGMSPAWGVGCWFVPIVNLWMPYLAVRDCLPDDDPHRARVLWWWMAWLVAQALGIAVGVSSMFSSGTALALSVPAALAYLAVVAWSPGIVSAIADAHRDAMERLSGVPGPRGASGAANHP